jgi:predicted ATPase
MLRSIALTNFRAYRDTGDIPLNKLNIFLGANNAGKTTFASAIEVYFRSLVARGLDSPLRLDEISSLTSFDSILRKHWSPQEPRPKEFVLGYGIGTTKDQVKVTIGYREGGVDNSPIAHAIHYEFEKTKISLNLESRKGSPSYSVEMGHRSASARELIFSGLIPFPALFEASDKLWQEIPRRLIQLSAFRRHQSLEIVNPSRPVPRSAYVLDDPNLGVDDRDLLSYLVSIFNSDDPADVGIKNLIINSLDTLGLAKNFEVATISKKTSTKIVSLKVSPTNKRQKVTIADVGFGLSQVLPLVVKDARLNKGVLIAYQPEVHLHPRAQSRLADIFAESVGRGNQVFVETHSPDLILRLQLLISTGKISASDVSVFCFENSAGSTNIEIVNFEKGGAPLMKWPAGFLDTSLSLARELAGARAKISSPNHKS